MEKIKYVTVKSSNIIIAIGEDLGQGFSATILETFLPTEEDLADWSDKKTDKWIAENNKRMEDICQFLNDREHGK